MCDKNKKIIRKHDNIAYRLIIYNKSDYLSTHNIHV